MCGIVGIFERNGVGSPESGDERLRHMLQTLSHRGPDDEGMVRRGAVHLGHRRLAVIDISAAGHQPMQTEDGRFTLVFNGEIYNYRALQQQFLADQQLRSSSDTEVLLYLLAGQGEKVLPLLRGMFAFALWDAQEQRLLLARDSFGKKPLYYAVTKREFLFASEAKALLRHPAVSRTLDTQHIPKYFLYEYIPTPATPYTQIRQVLAGSYLNVDASALTIRHWWSPQFVPKHTFTSERALLRALDEKLAQAVARRLVADVPVGIFLSGGLDSSTILWYMNHVAPRSHHSFSVSFNEKSFDEAAYARRAATALGATHHDIRFDVASFKTTLVDLVQAMDVPLADASLLPTYRVSQLARQHVTVVLDGDGSDELFGGYGTFAAAEAAEKLNWVPSSVWRGLLHTAYRLPTKYSNFSWDFIIKAFLRGMGYPIARRNQVWLGSFNDHELTDLLQPAWQIPAQRLYEDVDQAVATYPRLTPQDTVSMLTSSFYLHNDILVKLDRATMLVSLEARTPFLDVDVSEFAMKLPSRYKRNKYILKKLMQGRLPVEIIKRRKKGFGIPLGVWLRGPLRAWAAQVLDEDKIAQDGVLNPRAVRRLLDEHSAGRADHRKKLWTLLTWQMWYDQWITKRGIVLP